MQMLHHITALKAVVTSHALLRCLLRASQRLIAPKERLSPGPKVIPKTLITGQQFVSLS